MAGSSEVGAAQVDVKSYKCSITKITASTEWENPDGKKETVTTSVFDKDAKEGKTIYVITSPKGQKVTIKTDRDEGQCQRDNHKTYKMKADDYTIDETKDVTLASRVPQNKLTAKISALKLPVYSYALINNPQEKEETIKNSEDFTIKCYEIGGALEALKYWNLPIPTLKNQATQFSLTSCKEGFLNYQIISYPDICFYLEVTIGTNEAKKKKNGRSHFLRQTRFPEKYLDDRAEALIKEAPGVEMKLLPPSFVAGTKYNGGQDEIEVKLDLDTDNEIFHFNYKHDSLEADFGSELLQEIPSTIKKIKELSRLIKKFSKVEKNFKELGIDMVKNYKPYKIKLNPPEIILSVDGKYQTSRDLTKIGRLYDICGTCEPLISISLTIDLLFLILSAVSGGTVTGIYVMLKELEKVIGKLLGQYWKKKYKATKPFECDIYFDLVITGAINGNVHWLIDTTETKANSTKGSIEGVLKVDLKAGFKASVRFLYIVSASGEVSASASSGIKVKIGCVNRIAQGEGLTVSVDTSLLELKVSYCVQGSAGLFQTFSFNAGIKGEAVLWKEKKFDLFSGQAVFFTEKSGSGSGSGLNKWGQSSNVGAGSVSTIEGNGLTGIGSGGNGLTGGGGNSRGGGGGGW